MRKLTLLIIFISITVCTFSQVTGVLKNQKDTWGTEYTYVGEVKNRKANGLGMAIYNNNTANYYVGYFVNGQFSGKGVVMFTHGGFLSGDWKEGKLNGKGATLNKDRNFFVGDFVNGEKTGKGTLIYKDNGFITGGFNKDQFHGRNIYIATKGDILNDNLYRESKKNGSGFQYEVETKKLWEGEWANGDWVKSTDASYNSFVKNSVFIGEKTAKQIIMGMTDKRTNLLQDSAFYYDLNNRKRYFGRFDKGFLTNGILIRDDSSRFIGKLDNIGATGYCHYYKVDNYYDEGLFADDLMNGPQILSIDLKKGTVYYGGAVKGQFTGKAFFIDTDKSLYYGTYTKGKFTGDGWRLTKEGILTKGNFDDGYPVRIASITDGEGKAVDLNPKNMADAIAYLSKQYDTKYSLLMGKIELDFETYLTDPDFLFDYGNVGIYNVPGAQKNFAVTDYVGEDAYISLYAKTSDLERAKSKYRELCRSVQSAMVKKDPSSAAVRLEGDIDEIEGSSNNFSDFHFPGEDHGSDFHVSVVFFKVSDNDYRVYLAFGSRELVDYWVFGE